jgi:hypothetical protein
MPQFLLGLITLLSLGVSAQECKPEYKIRYETCADPSNPKEAKNINTGWILVNQGARKISDAICTDHIATLQRRHPAAKNIRFLKLDDRDASFRGLGKRDVYCQFEMEDVVTLSLPNPACGIHSAGTDCVQGLNKQILEQCVSEVPQTLEEKWTKSACLIDGLKNAAQIQGLDEASYNAVKFQLQLLRESLALGRSPEEVRLLAWIRSQTRQ